MKYQSVSFYLFVFEVSKNKSQSCMEKHQQVMIYVTNEIFVSQIQIITMENSHNGC